MAFDLRDPFWNLPPLPPLCDNPLPCTCARHNLDRRATIAELEMCLHDGCIYCPDQPCTCNCHYPAVVKQFITFLESYTGVETFTPPEKGARYED